jgi:hypothetical protein
MPTAPTMTWVWVGRPERAVIEISRENTKT